MAAEVTAHPTVVHKYGLILEQLVRDDIAADPARFGAARSWTDLHDVCDANDYLEEADRIIGIAPVADYLADGYLTLTNLAIQMASARLWPTT